MHSSVAHVLAACLPQRPRWQLSPLVPAAHGVFALGTVLFAVLAAVSTR